MSDSLKKSPKKYTEEPLVDRFLTLILYPIRVFLYYFCFQFLFRIVYKIYYRTVFDKKNKKLPKDNFLVLGNHATSLDGFFLNTFLRRFIYFLVHDEVFKTRFRKIIAYNLFGQISRGKSKNDIAPIRKLMRLKAEGKCIGIFPEGDLSYIGKSLPIDRSIAKLAKILDMPIVLTRFDGAAMQRPRWGYGNRFNKIKLTVTDVISLEELRHASIEDLYNRIVTGISYDDTKYQLMVQEKIKSPIRAERLEYALYMCPDCHKVFTLKSRREKFFCTECGYTVQYNKLAGFDLIKGKSIIKNVSEWDFFQKSQTDSLIEKSKAEGSEILELCCVSYNRTRTGGNFYKAFDSGKISLNHERLKFTSDIDKKEEVYPISSIFDLYIQFRGALEFSVGEYRYRFISKNKEHYGYSFECIIDAVKKQLQRNGKI